MSRKVRESAQVHFSDRNMLLFLHIEEMRLVMDFFKDLKHVMMSEMTCHDSYQEDMDLNSLQQLHQMPPSAYRISNHYFTPVRQDLREL